MNAASDLATFLGRFHPVLVHLPIGLIVLLALFEFISRWPRFRRANSNTGFILAFAVPISIITAACGWLLSSTGGYDASLLQWHKWTGIATASACLLAALLYAANLRHPYRVVLFATVALLAVSSHYGGSLTHGRGYLVQYAPKTLRPLLRLNDRLSATAQPGSATPVPMFASLLQPFFQENCVPCHGPEKSKGGLRLDSMEALWKGGENGPVLLTGKSGESQMIERMLLPLEHDDHMPPDGKPQPKPEDITLLRWWIDSGASSNATLAQLKPPPNVLRIAQSKLGESAQKSGAMAEATAKEVAPKPAAEVQPLAAKLADDLGIAITFLGENDPWLQCNASPAGHQFGDAQLQRLQPLAVNIRWLDISGTGITDAGFGRISSMPNLVRLHAERTGMSDAALEHLVGLDHLEYLDLYGTEITDAGLELLQRLPALKHLFLWQTKVTSGGATSFLNQRINKDQIKQWEAEIEVLKNRIRDQQITVDLGTPLTNTQAASTGQKPINSSCPVSGKPIDPSRTSEYQGKLVAFCCGDCKAKFDQDPKPFLSKIGLASETK